MLSRNTPEMLEKNDYFDMIPTNPAQGIRESPTPPTKERLTKHLKKDILKFRKCSVEKKIHRLIQPYLEYLKLRRSHI